MNGNIVRWFLVASVAAIAIAQQASYGFGQEDQVAEESSGSEVASPPAPKGQESPDTSNGVGSGETLPAPRGDGPTVTELVPPGPTLKNNKSVARRPHTGHALLQVDVPTGAEVKITCKPQCGCCLNRGETTYFAHKQNPETTRYFQVNGILPGSAVEVQVRVEIPHYRRAKDGGALKSAAETYRDAHSQVQALVVSLVLRDCDHEVLSMNDLRRAPTSPKSDTRSDVQFLSHVAPPSLAQATAMEQQGDGGKGTSDGAANYPVQKTVTEDIVEERSTSEKRRTLRSTVETPLIPPPPPAKAGPPTPKTVNKKPVAAKANAGPGKAPSPPKPGSGSGPANGGGNSASGQPSAAKPTTKTDASTPTLSPTVVPKTSPNTVQPPPQATKK